MQIAIARRKRHDLDTYLRGRLGRHGFDVFRIRGHLEVIDV